jgi:probable rRNA maturation factor
MMDGPYEIDISNRQACLSVDVLKIRRAIVAALRLEQVAEAVISVSIVDNNVIRTLNRDHLDHDYATDVISFCLEFELPERSRNGDERTRELTDSAPNRTDARRACGARLEGEIVVSAEMAVSVAPEHQWDADSELTLYVLHGLLHLCGYDDLTPEEQSIMRCREQSALRAAGVV